VSIPGHVALQRAAAPWGDNNYWGQFDADTDLVNVAGAAFQIGGDLQAGDVAWVVGDTALFVCTDPTPGAAAWMQISAGNGGGSLTLSASQLDNPVNADWAVNALAPAAADSNNAALTVRLFDDSTEEGVGWQVNVPTGATNLILRLKSRAETAPGAAADVVLHLYSREIPDNAAVGAWSAAFHTTPVSLPTNEFFQYDEETITLASLSINPGSLYQFELTRDGVDGSDTLVGDWDLLELEVGFF
jgi:hypothetical protein